jgi:hypothetical protein
MPDAFVGKLTYVVLVGQDLEGWLDDTASESENKMEGGLLLDVW